jgi:glycosyltransferase involved in cell wall biosynthesis
MDAVRPLVVCLLPVRDGEQDLPGFLASAASACDAVVALDDGSRDATADLLQASPLVATLLRNPPRKGYAGWDDAANRTRLLEAAMALDPQWVLSLDTDERLDPDDAAALRRFLATDALPGCAFGLQHHRMWGPDRCDPHFTWVYRVFAPRPGQRFPARRLHFDPVPTDIPRRAWLRTTIRVRHLGSATEARRLAAVAKYREADPGGSLTRDFGGLLSPPASLRPWRPRAAGLPVLLPARGAAARVAPADGGGGAKRRSRLVCLLPARNCAGDLPGHLASVARFADAVVALDDGSTDDTADVLRESPLVRILLHNPRREGYGEWDEGVDRNRLLAAAAALDPDWILFLDADERLDEGDAAALRAFVDGEAQPGVAYGFEVVPMAGDGTTSTRDGAGGARSRRTACSPSRRATRCRSPACTRRPSR